jgi:DNA-binding beta-propeller fold protein YncE
LGNGNLVVADTGNRRVQILDWLYNYLAELDDAEFPFEEPLAVGVNSRDEILVLDSTLQTVYRYDAEGAFIDRFGGSEARLFHPRGLAVFADDTVALADTGSARLAFFTPAGEQAGSLGSLGNGPGQMNEPTDVVQDNQNTYFVVEAENDRIQRLDAAGNPLNQWPIPPAYAYNGPHLALAPDGSVLMTESQSDALLRYSPAGILLNQWQAIDSVSLVDPVGLYVDETNNLLYLTDVGTHQVHVFELQLAAN